MKRAKKVPRSYRAGDLLSLLSSDLPGHNLERDAVAQGRFVPKSRGLPGFEARERVITHFLGHVTVTVFTHRPPGTDPGRGRASLRTSGTIRRTGLDPKVIDGNGDAESIATFLCDDPAFRESALDLDFKRFELIGDRDGWTAEIELVGASQVVTAIPPIRRYIRLYPDQRDALLGVFRSMDMVLGRTGGSPARARLTEPFDVNDVPVAWREAGAGGLVLFLHGLGGSRTAWEPQLQSLSDEFRCVAWDMPGYGASPPLAGGMTWEGLAGAVSDLVTSLGETRAHIVGLSLGGMITQHTALLAPQLVRSLTLLDTSPRFGMEGKTTAEDWVRDRLEPLDQGETPQTIAAAVIRSIVAPGTPQEVIDEAGAAMGRIPVAGFRQAVRLLPTHNLLDRLPEVTAPTLVAVGELDEETPPPYARALAERIPNARLELIGGAGHYSNLEKPDEVNRVLRRFIESVG